MTDAAKLLSSLEERILKQLAYEWHDPDDALYKYNNMTVPEFLRMLSYILDDEK